MELVSVDMLPNNPPHPFLRRAGIEDVDAMIELRRQIAEFHTPSTAGERMKRSMSSGAMRAYVIGDGGSMAASASTSAENSRSAMVAGVCTHPEHRGKGYATACVAALCRDVLAEGKSLCLFFDNPQAGAIYERIGFRPIGEWSMCYAPTIEDRDIRRLEEAQAIARKRPIALIGLVFLCSAAAYAIVLAAADKPEEEGTKR